MVFSPKGDGTGNYTIVSKKALAFLVKKLGGRRGLATTDVFNACKGSMWFPDKFAALNALYALIGLKGARIWKRQGAKLFFLIYKGPFV